MFTAVWDMLQLNYLLWYMFETYWYILVILACRAKE